MTTNPSLKRSAEEASLVEDKRQKQPEFWLFVLHGKVLAHVRAAFYAEVTPTRDDNESVVHLVYYEVGSGADEELLEEVVNDDDSGKTDTDGLVGVNAFNILHWLASPDEEHAKYAPDGAPDKAGSWTWIDHEDFFAGLVKPTPRRVVKEFLVMYDPLDARLTRRAEIKEAKRLAARVASKEGEADADDWPSYDTAPHSPQYQPTSPHYASDYLPGSPRYTTGNEAAQAASQM